MRKVSSLIMVGVVFTAMFLQGCKITFNKADFGKAIVEETNLKVLTYEKNSYTSYDENIYYFLVDPANDLELGAEIKEVYDAHKDYEINNQDYWTYFEDIDFHFSDNVT